MTHQQFIIALYMTIIMSFAILWSNWLIFKIIKSISLVPEVVIYSVS
jgi:hypothetical protein